MFNIADMIYLAGLVVWFNYARNIQQKILAHGILASNEKNLLGFGIGIGMMIGSAMLLTI